jgi:tripartite ATP-independent transporter DctM subunit
LDWWWALAFIFGSLIILFSTGFPVAFSFLLINIVGIFFFWGGEPGLRQLILSIYASLTNFILVPVPMFFLMGEIMFQSGVAMDVINALDKWLGRLPGRLSLLTVASSTVLSALTGVPMASVALLGTTLMPEMEKRGYHRNLIIGPIIGAGGLAMLIPPSAIAVLLAGIAEISVSGVLIGGIGPGIILAGFYSIYIIIRCWLNPSLAPTYDVSHVLTREKVRAFLIDILPLTFVIFMVIGVMFLGVATPTEAATSGALGSIILAACRRRLTWGVIKRSLIGTTRLTVMVFMIVAGSTAFCQMLAFSQASKGLVQLMTGLPLSPILIVMTMQFILLVMGCFMDLYSIMMITIPIFFPIIKAVGLDPLWFGILFLLNMEIAPQTPPFGLELFVMKGVAPKDVTMADIWRAASPFVLIEIFLLWLMIIFPDIALWLPSLVKA